MSAAADEKTDKTALAEIFAARGVTVSAEDIDNVGRSLARINEAASGLFGALSFDDTAERFLQLLEGDHAKGAGE